MFNGLCVDSMTEKRVLFTVIGYEEESRNANTKTEQLVNEKHVSTKKVSAIGLYIGISFTTKCHNN